MTDAEILTIVKSDLNELNASASRQAFLLHLISVSKVRLAEMGYSISANPTINDCDLIRMYVDYLVRKRDSESGMPRALKLAINNGIFHQKMGSN